MRNGPASDLSHTAESAKSNGENSEAAARYLADMTGQLEAMARGAGLELLAYLLAMARAEAEAAVIEGHMDLRSPPR